MNEGRKESRDFQKEGRKEGRKVFWVSPLREEGKGRGLRSWQSPFLTITKVSVWGRRKVCLCEARRFVKAGGMKKKEKKRKKKEKKWYYSLVYLDEKLLNQFV